MPEENDCPNLDPDVVDLEEDDIGYESEATQTIERDNGQQTRFSGCYLLQSLKRVRTYIGFTVNPTRRLKQHNGEIVRGGAKRTSVNRPWAMVAVVHGFFSSSQALQFEWAWQNPTLCKSIRTHAGIAKPAPGTHRPRFQFRTPTQQVEALALLLSVPPWCHSPLSITVPGDKELWYKALGKIKLPDWICVEFRSVEAMGKLEDYDFGSWMPVPERPLVGDCGVCEENTGRTRRGTICVACGKHFHLHCLAAEGIKSSTELGEGAVIPASVQCTDCKRTIRWSELVRFARVVRRSLPSAPPSIEGTGKES